MKDGGCHQPSPRDAVKTLILETFGVKRVAHWCEVTEGAVYQWLSRATDAEPFPVKRVPAILAAARRERVAFDAAPLRAILGLEPETAP